VIRPGWFWPSARASVASFAALLCGVVTCGTGETIVPAGDAGEPAPGCAHPGMPTPGPADMHCQSQDGGAIVREVDAASCYSVAQSDGGDLLRCAYGATMFGTDGDEDDCKFHVVWENLTPICEGASGVSFRVTVTQKTDGAPLMGANPGAEVFTTTPGDWDAGSYCDTASTHVGPNSYLATFAENPPGTYTGTIVFDRSGQWTVRFHFFGNCYGGPDSPHGHAAFHVTVP